MSLTSVQLVPFQISVSAETAAPALNFSGNYPPGDNYADVLSAPAPFACTLLSLMSLTSVQLVPFHNSLK